MENIQKRSRFDLEDRLIEFASRVLDIAEALPPTVVAKHFAGQITRSCTSPAFQYGEAQAAESRADFVHKMGIGLKELRETLVCLKLIVKRKYFSEERLLPIMQENNELISIFVKSIGTAKTNDTKRKH
jgi:four helix bundle protein